MEWKSWGTAAIMLAAAFIDFYKKAQASIELRTNSKPIAALTREDVSSSQDRPNTRAEL
jgi:hypothetical protein